MTKETAEDRKSSLSVAEQQKVSQIKKTTALRVMLKHNVLKKATIFTAIMAVAEVVLAVDK